MSLTPRLRLGILLLLALAMAATRMNHFALVPDASWAVFFVAGFYLRGQARWAFPALMALAVAVDYAVISRSGLDFWSHYCVSPGYWFLLPAYFAMWTGGALLRQYHAGPAPRALGLLVLSVLASVALCHLFAQGGFYWFSDAVAEPSLAGWWKNYSDWLLPYLRTSALYIGLAAAAHVALGQLLRHAPVGAGGDARR